MIDETLTKDENVEVEKETENQFNKIMDNLHFSQTISPTLDESDSEFDKISNIGVDEVSVMSVVSDLEDVDYSDFVEDSAFVNNSDNVENVHNQNVNMVGDVNESACIQNVNENVFMQNDNVNVIVDENENKKCEKVENVEKIKIKDITYNTLKNKDKLKGILIDGYDSINSSDSSESSKVKAILLPKIKNVPN